MLSVLLPCRDLAGSVSAAARSVLAEPEVNDLVAIDDGSVDGTAERLEALAQGDRRVVVVRTGGVGVARALTLGLERARGDFVGRMDGDDVSLPRRFERSLALLASDRALGAVAVQVEAAGAGEGLKRYVRWQNALLSPAEHARDRFVESPVCHPAVTLSREALASVGGWRDCPWPQDWDLWLRLVAAGWGLAKVPEVLFRWVHREDRVTFREPRCAPDALVRARAHYLAPHLQRPFVIWGAGKTGRRLARALEAEGVAPDGFVDIDPSKIGRTARGLPIAPASEALAGGRLILVAVGAPGAGDEPCAREVVRARLVASGLEEGRSFICAA